MFKGEHGMATCYANILAPLRFNMESEAQWLQLYSAVISHQIWLSWEDLMKLCLVWWVHIGHHVRISHTNLEGFSVKCKSNNTYSYMNVMKYIPCLYVDP